MRKFGHDIENPQTEALTTGEEKNENRQQNLKRATIATVTAATGASLFGIIDSSLEINSIAEKLPSIILPSSVSDCHDLKCSDMVTDINFSGYCNLNMEMARYLMDHCQIDVMNRMNNDGLCDCEIAGDKGLVRIFSIVALAIIFIGVICYISRNLLRGTSGDEQSPLVSNSMLATTTAANSHSFGNHNRTATAATSASRIAAFEVDAGNTTITPQSPSLQ